MWPDRRPRTKAVEKKRTEKRINFEYNRAGAENGAANFSCSPIAQNRLLNTCLLILFNMGKKSKSQGGTPAVSSTGSSLPFLGGNASVDPSLASLFEQSVRILTGV